MRFSGVPEMCRSRPRRRLPKGPLTNAVQGLRHPSAPLIVVRRSHLVARLARPLVQLHMEWTFMTSCADTAGVALLGWHTALIPSGSLNPGQHVGRHDWRNGMANNLKETAEEYYSFPFRRYLFGATGHKRMYHDFNFFFDASDSVHHHLYREHLTSLNLGGLPCYLINPCRLRFFFRLD